MRIIYKDVPDRSTQLAYVTNPKGTNVVVVTIAWATYYRGSLAGQGEKDYVVAPGKEVFVGGTKAFDREVTHYNIKAAYYK